MVKGPDAEEFERKFQTMEKSHDNIQQSRRNEEEEELFKDLNEEEHSYV